MTVISRPCHAGTALFTAAAVLPFAVPTQSMAFGLQSRASDSTTSAPELDDEYSKLARGDRVSDTKTTD